MPRDAQGRLRQAMISEEERIVIMGRLYDFYGQLLTPHRQRIYEMAVYEDLSLAEIAEREGISRQAVHDLLRRTTAMLEQYEEKLKMMRRFDAIRAIASSLEDRELAQRIIKELD